ncbi:MAG: methylenetetrahydrofolate reductase [NAD(P)H] [Gammaproteobacteria bacterium]|nr:methylenetetrahydrofolate reductase [NAD(P)H] [Gammaproteobacteria bacterium]
MESQKKLKPEFSIEFFPPKTEEGKLKLRTTREELAKLKPAYISVTFGAGGSTQQGTFDTIKEIKDSGINAAPHISCIGQTKAQVKHQLQRYIDIGINRIVALRGDIPSGMGLSTAGDFQHANELVAFIRQETGNHFHIEVAAYPEFHPQARSARDDLENFKRKVQAGADSAITQYFFNPDAYYRFLDDCAKMGIDVPVVPGIMPITNYTQLMRFSDMCGAEVPRWIRKRLEAFGDDVKSIQEFGAEVTTRLCQKLLNSGCPGLHFYCMNKSSPTDKIWAELSR